jgi:hypothetical protein
MPIIIPETIVPWTLRVNGISPFSLGFMTLANIFSSPMRPSNLLLCLESEDIIVIFLLFPL